MSERCNIKHGFGDQRCVRREGHDGSCRSAWYRGVGTITRSWWRSVAGRFRSHERYETHYPPNARRPDAD